MLQIVPTLCGQNIFVLIGMIVNPLPMAKQFNVIVAQSTLVRFGTSFLIVFDDFIAELCVCGERKYLYIDNEIFFSLIIIC